MCLGVLAKVVDVEDIIAKVDIGGVVVEAVKGVEELHPGDIVIVHAGVVIKRVTLDDVLANLYVIYELQKTHYLLNGLSEEEASKRALDDIKRYASSLGINESDVEQKIKSVSEEDVAKFFTEETK